MQKYIAGIKKFLNILKTNKVFLQLDHDLNNKFRDFFPANRPVQNSIEAEIFNHLLNLNGECYRLVKSRSTLRVQLFEQVYFIKKYYPVKLKEILKNIISLRSPFNSAIGEYKATLAVRQQKIKTLDIVGYGIKKNLLSSTSFIITKAIEPNISADQLLEKYLNHRYYFKLKRRLIEFLAKITSILHRNGLNHRDYYICHFLVKINDDLNKLLAQGILDDELIQMILNNIYLIDLHRMQIRHAVPKRFIIKDLSALLFSVRNYKLTKTDYMRFIKIYNHELLKQVKTVEKIISKANHMREKG